MLAPKFKRCLFWLSGQRSFPPACRPGEFHRSPLSSCTLRQSRSILQFARPWRHVSDNQLDATIATDWYHCDPLTSHVREWLTRMRPCGPYVESMRIPSSGCWHASAARKIRPMQPVQVGGNDLSLKFQHGYALGVQLLCCIHMSLCRQAVICCPHSISLDPKRAFSRHWGYHRAQEEGSCAWICRWRRLSVSARLRRLRVEGSRVRRVGLRKVSGALTRENEGGRDKSPVTRHWQ